jgi:hypothetical protein
MSYRVFRSPRSGSAAAATAPARLASELNTEVLWRECPDGALEIATKRDGVVNRYLVQEDGSVLPTGSVPPLSPLRRGTPIAVGGGLLIAAAVVMGAMGVIRDEGAVGVGFVGWILVMLGFGIRSYSAELSNRVKDEGTWNNPTDLHGWLPRTTQQLGAVEQIADEHDGLAFVRDIGTKTVEVCAMQRGELKHFWVDESGRAEVMEKRTFTRRHFIDRALERTAVALFIGIFVLGFGFDRWELAAALGACIVGVMIFGWLNDRQLSLERRIKKMPDEGRLWIEIRTRVEVADGD